VAFTAEGEARVVAERLDAAPVVAVELRVARVQDHLMEGRTELLDGARWRFSSERDTEAASRSSPSWAASRASRQPAAP
jgi:hypothetical protein